MEKTIVAEEFMERFRDLINDSSVGFCADTFDIATTEFMKNSLSPEKNPQGYQRFPFIDCSAVVFYNGFLEVEGEREFTFKYNRHARK